MHRNRAGGTRKKTKNSHKEALELETPVTSGGRGAMQLKMVGLIERLCIDHFNSNALPLPPATNKPYPEKKLSLPIQAENRRFIG